jgi:membrane-bound lytic murein transglycosylase D
MEPRRNDDPATSADRAILRRTLPLWGGALVVTLAASLALLASRTSPGPGSPVLDRVTRSCRIAHPPLALDPGALHFDGAFARRPAAADSAVERWIRIFRDRHPGMIRTFLARASAWEDRIRPVLARHGVPEDFLYLAVIESGMDPHAYSRAHAVGMWQFLAGTGRRQGLRVAWAVDERRDPVAATDAAARYLREMYDRFGDWALAAAAYNAGPYRVARVRRWAGGDADYWELSRRRLLPRETREYVPKLLATARLAHDPGGQGLGYVPSLPPTRFREVTVEPASRLEAVARAAAVPLEEVRALNPHLVRDLTPPSRPSRVRLPPGVGTRFALAWSRIPEEERRGGLTHVVRHRETLSRIARSYGVSVGEIRAANDQVNPRRLRPGQRLNVPVGLR